MEKSVAEVNESSFIEFDNNGTKELVPLSLYYN
jgi:hypothetical protein